MPPNFEAPSDSQDKAAAPVGLDQACPGAEAMEWEA